MKSIVKKLLITIITIIGGIGISCYVIKSVDLDPKIVGEVLLITVAAVVTATIGALWSKDILNKIFSTKIEKLAYNEKPILIKPNPHDENAHLQNLNVVYQKLFHLRLWEMSDNQWIMQALVELNGDQLTHAQNIPDLNRAITHLEQNPRYKNLASLWNDLESCVNEYNKNIPAFIEYLENKIRKTMAEKTKHVEQKNDNEGYSVYIMRCALMYLLPLQSEGKQLEGSFDLRISKIYNFFIWFETQPPIVHNALFFIVNGNPEVIRDEIGKLLFEIARDRTVLNKYRPHHKRLQKIKDAENQFKANLKPLIHDIEKNGFTVIGECDLGY